ncbi:uncharacterized SAM-binding protein YcdF (DUF218 family) [Bradyrhizobium sp. F1.13.4]
MLPINFMIELGIVSVVLMATRFAAFGRKLAAATLILLALAAFSPLGNLLLYPLESRFAPWDPSRGAPDGIIVLGGSVDTDLSAAHRTPVVAHAADRLFAPAELARRYPSTRIVFTGGTANLVSTDSREADYSAPILENLGIAKQRLILERGLSQHLRECHLHQTIGGAQTGRTLAPGHLGLSHAAFDGDLSQGGI